VSSSRTIVVTAMADELGPLLERATEVGDETGIAGGFRRDAVLGGVPVVFVQSGVGMVNGAITVAAVVSAEQAAGHTVDLVVSAGTAGGIGHGIVVGDVVVASECISGDADARAFGYVLGQVPRMPATYPSDPRVLEIAVTLPGVIPGLILSSDTFVTPTRAEVMRLNFPGASGVDMESAAIAQTSFRFGLPFVSVRGISDGADESAASSFKENVVIAADRSADVVVSILESLQR
jgi:adenosylhomocysteine nucleosidase